MNGQVGTSVRPQMNQTSMARHPSREQLIDYLMLKVSQQPHGPPRVPHETLQQEVMWCLDYFIFALSGFRFICTGSCFSGLIQVHGNDGIPEQNRSHH